RRVRSLQGLLPQQPAREAVTGPGLVGGIPPGDRGQRGADAGEQRDAGARGLPDLAGGVSADRGGTEKVLPGVRAEESNGHHASGLWLSYGGFADAGGSGADAGRVRARVGAGVHGVHGALMNSYLVCYDIANPKRLRKVAMTCEDFGRRKQYSVFLCRLTA